MKNYIQLMSRSIAFAFIIVASVSLSSLYAQSIPVTMETVGVGNSVTQEEKEMSLNAARVLVEQYENNCAMANDDQENNFYDLFESNASIFNDLEQKPKARLLSIDDYTSKALFVQDGNGFVSSLIEDAAIANIYKERGVIKVKLNFSKSLSVQLDENSDPFREKEPAIVDLTFKFKVDPFTPEEPIIEEVTGKYRNRKIKVVKEKKQEKLFVLPSDNSLSIGFTRSIFGNISVSGESAELDANSDNVKELNLGEASLTNNAGVYLNYRRALGKKAGRPNLYGVFGLSINSLSVSTAISSFRAEYIDASATVPYRETLENLELGDLEFVQADRVVDNLDEDFSENVDLLLAQLSFGMEYRVIKQGASGLFVGLNFNTQYLLGGEGATNGSFEESLIPKDVQEFPDFENIPDDVLDSYYRTSTDEGEFGIDVSSNVSFSISPNLRYQYIYTRKIGFEFGLQYNLGLTSLYKTVNRENDFLSGTSTDRTTSILEDYFDSSKASNASFSIGLVYLLN